MLLFLSFGIKAQNPADVQNYTVTAGSNESLVDDATGWTTLIGGNQINVASAVNNIGFEVWFMGERFTTFSANTGGVMRFGNTPIIGGANSPSIADNARVCVFGASITTAADKWRTGNNGYVRYKVTGTAPDRKLIIDWVNIRMKGSAPNNTGISRFQAHISETAPANANGGVVRIVYGRMFIQSHAPTTGCTGNDQTTTYTGIGYSTSTTQGMFINTDNHPSLAGTTINYGANGTDGYPSCNSFGAAPTNVTSLNSTTNGSRKYYEFNPPLPNTNVTFVSASCVSDNELLINWTAPAGNQVGYVVYRSLDGVNYSFLTQTNTLTTNFIDTGLTAGTTYYYRVFTVTEGRLSAVDPTVNEVSATTTISPTVFSVISNIWSSTTTWSTSSVPVAAENVVIGCPTPHTVTVNTNGVANDLTIENGSVLNFNAGQTITTEGDVINKGTININNGTLRIKGNLINTTGAVVNVGNGELIVEGDFQNEATAILNGDTGLFRLAGDFINEGEYNSNTSTMRFDGNAQQLINHTGTSSGQGIITASNSYNNAADLFTPGTPAIPGTPIAIPDNNAAGVSQTVNFPATTQTITNVTLGLQIDHTWVGDLIVRLTSPDGTTRTLIDRPGIPPSTYGCSGNNIDVLLSDAGGSDVEDECGGGTPTINGTFRPNQSLADFINEDPTGDWILTVSDNVGGDTGDFVSGSLNVTTALGTTSVPINAAIPATPATPGLSIPDNSNAGVNHTINVPTTGTIESVRMDIAIDHTYIGNLRITLTSPNGTTRRMMNRVINGTGGCDEDNLSITFDDLALDAVQTQCGGGNPSINGTYTPEQSLTNFIGEDQQGDWIINISDRAGGDIGRVMSANLHITTSVPVPFPLSSALYYHKLEMQNTGAEVRTQNTDIWITNNATWTTGVFRADNNHMIIFPDNATSTVAINASHADMKVRKIGDDAFDFPVGNAGWGAPIGISAPVDVTDHFTAQYFHQITPTDFTSKEASIHHVGLCEYWILDRTSGTSNVVVTLSYDDIRSCTTGPTAGLKVIRWDGAIWRDHFNGGIINAPYDGVLSLGTVTDFSPFTLGALTDLNILPLTFLSFDAKPLESDAILDWTTTGELNHDYFEIERSINGQDFEKIGSIKNPVTKDNTKNTYSFIDKNVGIENSEAYYRLKQIDTNGTFSYSNTKRVNWSIDNSQNKALFVAYPNPFTDILTLDFDLDRTENVEIVLMDMAGRKIKTISQSFDKGSHKLELNNLQKLAQGSYLIQLKTNTLQKTFKVVKM